MAAPKDVAEYIRSAPADARKALSEVRAAIRRGAPRAREGISYGMPSYAYPGASGIDARLCYFGLQQGGIGVYFRPRDLEPHSARIAPFQRTKSALRFRLNQPIPTGLICELVRSAWTRRRPEVSR